MNRQPNAFEQGFKGGCGVIASIFACILLIPFAYFAYLFCVAFFQAMFGV